MGTQFGHAPKQGASPKHVEMSVPFQATLSRYPLTNQAPNFQPKASAPRRPRLKVGLSNRPQRLKTSVPPDCLSLTNKAGSSTWTNTYKLMLRLKGAKRWIQLKLSKQKPASTSEIFGTPSACRRKACNHLWSPFVDAGPGFHWRNHPPLPSSCGFGQGNQKEALLN